MRIIIFDDDPAILALCQEVLRMEGYDVFTSNYGTNDLQRITNAAPDLAILDCPPGREDRIGNLLEKLKTHDSGAQIPVILCSTDIKRLYNIHNFWDLPQIAMLTKPFDIDILVSTVRDALVFWGKIPHRTGV